MNIRPCKGTEKVKKNINQKAFFALLSAGLWEKEIGLSHYGDIDYAEIYRLAEEQSVIGLVTAGLEQVKDVKIPQEVLLQFIGSTLQIEQRNKTMNEYVAKLIERLRNDGVYALLVKGQGIAQCYEKPLWRSSGDVDLLLSENDYEKAKDILLPQSLSREPEYATFKHLSMTMPGGFEVELHGTLRSRLSARVDSVIDEVQRDVFFSGSVRSWMNNGVQVFLPGSNNDAIFVFTHILHHFYIEGIGLRQICDWCRLLWTYREKLDIKRLEAYIKKAGLMTEWKAFVALAVNYLRMPEEAMPFYDSSYKRKGEKIVKFVMETGNFGHNREHSATNSFVGGKFQSLWRKLRDFGQHAIIFPLDSVKFFFHLMWDGMKLVFIQNSAKISLSE